MDAPLSACRAHPRWRGEDTSSRFCHPASTGSSPLARGGRPINLVDRDSLRLIPAGAGRTPRGNFRRMGGRAHPRWRGEDGVCRPVVSGTWGSSPLARGGLRGLRRRRHRRRLIPAGAGRTGHVADRLVSHGAHPRWRGEDVSPICSSPGPNGSSPLARGGRTFSSRCWMRLGLIPAGAGRTCLTLSVARGTWAHPRWRGEDTFFTVKNGRAGGSSPLARGGRAGLGELD